jgi:hypothetical protein
MRAATERVRVCPLCRMRAVEIDGCCAACWLSLARLDAGHAMNDPGARLLAEKRRTAHR